MVNLWAYPWKCGGKYCWLEFERIKDFIFVLMREKL